MKVSTNLNHIDSGHMALPEFQRRSDFKRYVRSEILVEGVLA